MKTKKPRQARLTELLHASINNSKDIVPSGVIYKDPASGTLLYERTELKAAVRSLSMTGGI